MKAQVGALNQEKALVGAFSVIVKTGCGTDGPICGTTPHGPRTTPSIIKLANLYIDSWRSGYLGLSPLLSDRLVSIRSWIVQLGDGQQQCGQGGADHTGAAPQQLYCLA